MSNTMGDLKEQDLLILHEYFLAFSWSSSFLVSVLYFSVSEYSNAWFPILFIKVIYAYRFPILF